MLNRLAGDLGHSLRDTLIRVAGRGGPKVLTNIMLSLLEHTSDPFPCVHEVDQRKLGAWCVD